MFPKIGAGSVRFIDAAAFDLVTLARRRAVHGGATWVRNGTTR